MVAREELARAGHFFFFLGGGVWGLGFRVSGLGFGVQGLGPKV